MRIQRTSALPPDQQILVKDSEAAAGAEAGGIDFYVANSGPSQSNRKQLRDELVQMHANPTIVIVICECDGPAFQLLAAMCEKERKIDQYLWIKSKAPCNLLIGIRDNSGSATHCENYPLLKRKTERSNATNPIDGVSAAMVAHIELDGRMWKFGSSFFVMGVHVRNTLNNKNYVETKVEEFYTWFAEYISVGDVRAIMHG